MDILDSALEKEITTIFSTANPHYYYRAEFNIDGNVVEVMKVVSIDKVCDYEMGYADEVMIELAVGAGTYAYRIFPNMSNLEITLYRDPIGEVSQSNDQSLTSQSERFTATIINPQSPVLTGSDKGQSSEYSLNVSNIVNIKLQLINKFIEQFRMRSIGTTFRNTTPKAVIRSILGAQSSLINIEASLLPLGVDMVEPTNTAVREHIVIPAGTRAVDLPMYIQKKCGGVYSAGLAYYYHLNHWYVFQPYDVTRFDSSKATLTIIKMPANKMMGVERTYRVDNANIIALASGESNIQNDSDKKQLNQGNGVRFTGATSIFESPVSVSDNRAVMSRGSNNSEFTTVSRPNGLNNVQISKNKITDNQFEQYSQMAARDGAMVHLNWENSDPSLVYPGMPVKVMYLDVNEIKSMYGVVLQTHHYTKTTSVGFLAGRYSTTTVLTLFTKQDIAQA